MKWKMFGALAISIGMCSQGMAFELLNRMMSVGHGHRNCCEPTCCVADNACEPSCCVASNACEPSCCVVENACEPACCVNPCEQKCCKKQRKGLLDHLFGKRCKKSCCDSVCTTAAGSCGCNGGHGAPVPAEGAIDVAPPAPPAPTADPSARYNARRVVPTSARLTY